MNAEIEEAKEATGSSAELIAQYKTTNRSIRIFYMLINGLFLAIIFTTLILRLTDDTNGGGATSDGSPTSSSITAFSTVAAISVALSLLDIVMILYIKTCQSGILESVVVFLKESAILASILLRYSSGTEMKANHQYQELVFVILCIQLELKRRALLFPIPITMYQILIFFFVQDFSKSAIVYFSISLVTIFSLNRLDSALNERVDATLFQKAFSPTQSLMMQTQSLNSKGSLKYMMQFQFDCLSVDADIAKLTKKQRPQQRIDSFNTQVKIPNIPSTSPILLSGIPLEKKRSEIMQNSQMKSVELGSAFLNGVGTTMINSVAAVGGNGGGGGGIRINNQGASSLLNGLGSMKGVGSKMRQSSNLMLMSKLPSNIDKKPSVQRVRGLDGQNLLPITLPFQYLIAKQSQNRTKEIEILEMKNDFDLVNELLVDDLNMNVGSFIKLFFQKKYEDKLKLRKQSRLCSNADRSASYQMIVQFQQFSTPAPPTLDDFSPTHSQQVHNQKIPFSFNINSIDIQPQSAGIPASSGITTTNTPQTTTGHPGIANQNLDALLVLFFIEITDLCKEVSENAIQRAGGASKSYEEDLLATVSHDIKNLMNGMVQMLDLCEAEVLQFQSGSNNNSNKNERTINSMVSNVSSFLSHAQKNTQLLLFFVYDIQDFSQHAKQKLRLVPEATNLKEIGEEIEGIFDYQLKLNHNTFKFKSKLQSSIIWTDGLRLKQVLINLVSNAVKYTKSGSIQVLFEPTQYSELIRVTVSDTGSGIPESIRSQLFSYYATFDSKEGQNPRGVGLGLVITLKIVQQMGPDNQKIKIKSQPGSGTKISFLIFSKLHERHIFEGEITATSTSLLNRSQVRILNGETPQVSTTPNEFKKKVTGANGSGGDLIELKLMNRLLDARNDSDVDDGADRKQSKASLASKKQIPIQTGAFLASTNINNSNNNHNNIESSLVNTLSSRVFEGEPAELEEHNLESNLHSYQRLYSQSIPKPSSRVQRVTCDFTGRSEKPESYQLQTQNNTTSNQKSQESPILDSDRISSISMRHIDRECETVRTTTPIHRNESIPNTPIMHSLTINNNLMSNNGNFNLGKNMCGSIIISPQLSRQESKKCIRKMSSSYYLNSNQNLQGSNQNIPATNIEAIDVSNSDFEMILKDQGINHIMIIDDESINTFALKTTLRFLTDVRVSVGHSGTEVIDVLREDSQAVQLVFIDQNMPDLTGAETIDQIKEINPSIITILVSGFARIQDIQHNRPIQSDLFLVKPTRISDIKRKIVSYFMKRQADQFGYNEEEEDDYDLEKDKEEQLSYV